MKLIYVTERFPKLTETFVVNEVRELIRQGDRVTVCSLFRLRPTDRLLEADDLKSSIVEIRSRGWVLRCVAAALACLLRAPNRAVPALLWSVRWALRDRGASHLWRFFEAAYLSRRVPAGTDCVHAHFAHSSSTVGLLLARLLACRFSFTAHAWDIFRAVSPALVRSKTAEACFVVAVAEHTRAHLAAVVGEREGRKIHIVRNGIDLDLFAPRPYEPAGIPLVLSVGRLVPKKGHDVLLRACAMLTAEGREFRCEIVGDGPELESLEDQVARDGLAQRVVLLGARSPEEVRQAYARALVFALACRRAADGTQDGLPVAIVEAQAVGVPVVSTLIAGIGEAVRDGQSGLIVAPDDPTALARALARLLDDGTERQRLSAGGREVAREFDLSSCVARLRSLFAAEASING